MPRYVVVSFLPETVSYTLKRAREHFEPCVNAIIPPHISLTYPFWWDKGKNELVKTVETTVVEIAPFQATITDIKYFSKTKNTRGLKLADTGGLADRDLGNPMEKMVIYAQVLPEEPFIKVYNYLEKGLTDKAKFDTSQFPQKTLPSYIPHITLAMNGEKKDIEIAQKMISSVIGYSFMADKITLLKKDEMATSWQTIAGFCLKSKKE